jgi:myosin heavy subunit
VEDTVDETVSYSMEKAERALERLTNEKITAVSEYSQTVMTDIHKSHEQVMFLYDMLNDKQENIKDTATEVSLKVKEVGEALQEADQAKKDMSQAAKELDAALQNVTEASKQEEQTAFKPINLTGIERVKLHQKVKADAGEQKAAEMPVIAAPADADDTADTVSGEIPDVAMHFDTNKEQTVNNNERILELHRKGKSNVAIAKELGLGVGEVKLVIDLFKGI